MLALVLYLMFLIAAPAGAAIIIQHAFPAPDEAAFMREVTLWLLSYSFPLSLTL